MKIMTRTPAAIAIDFDHLPMERNVTLRRSKLRALMTEVGRELAYGAWRGFPQEWKPDQSELEWVRLNMWSKTDTKVILRDDALKGNKCRIDSERGRPIDVVRRAQAKHENRSIWDGDFETSSEFATRNAFLEFIVLVEPAMRSQIASLTVRTGDDYESTTELPTDFLPYVGVACERRIELMATAASRILRRMHDDHLDMFGGTECETAEATTAPAAAVPNLEPTEFVEVGDTSQRTKSATSPTTLDPSTIAGADLGAPVFHEEQAKLASISPSDNTHTLRADSGALAPPIKKVPDTALPPDDLRSFLRDRLSNDETVTFSELLATIRACATAKGKSYASSDSFVRSALKKANVKAESLGRYKTGPAIDAWVAAAKKARAAPSNAP